MKIYVMCDLEGITGIVNFEQQVKPGAPQYEEARRFLMSDLNGAIRGAVDGGGTSWTNS